MARWCGEGGLQSQGDPDLNSSSFVHPWLVHPLCPSIIAQEYLIISCLKSVLQVSLLCALERSCWCLHALFQWHSLEGLLCAFHHGTAHTVRHPCSLCHFPCPRFFGVNSQVTYLYSSLSWALLWRKPRLRKLP